jgi:hypothetical protein
VVNIGDRVGALCAQLSRWDSLEGIIRDGGAGEALDELMAAVRGDAAQVPDQLARLLDDIEEACARRGLAGITSRGQRHLTLPPGLSGPAEEGASPAWVCPCSRCERVVFPEQAETAPMCVIAGAAMKPFLVFP